MIKQIYQNSVAKKTTIFAVAFAITCMIMGLQFQSGEGEIPAQPAILPAPHAGQAAVRAVPEKPTADREIPVQTGVAFPFSGEYPSMYAEPLPVKPLIDTALPAPEGFAYCSDIPLSRELQQYTYSTCVQRELEYELVLALMWRESRFQTDAVNINTNGTQDSGIMQINDINRGWLQEEHGIDNLMDPVQNIDAGTIMLSGLVKKYGVHDALMAYQYGEQGMQKKFAQGVVTNNQIAMLIQQRDQYRMLLQST